VPRVPEVLKLNRDTKRVTLATIRIMCVSIQNPA